MEMLSPRIYIADLQGQLIKAEEAIKHPKRIYRCQYCSTELYLQENDKGAWFTHPKDNRPAICAYDRVNNALKLKAKSLDKNVDDLLEVNEGGDWYCLLCHHYYTVRGNRRCNLCRSGLYSILAHTLTEAHQRIFPKYDK